MNAPPRWAVGVLTRITDALSKVRRRLMPARYAAIELGTMSWVSLATAAFCELGLADALAHGPRTADELAEEGFGDRDRIFRLLRALAAYEVVAYKNDGRFALGYTGKALTGTDSVAAMVRYANARWHIAAYTRLAQAIREGGTALELKGRMPMFAFYERNPQAAQLFDAAMEAMTVLFAKPFAAAYDFSRIPHVVDVGGGTGLLLQSVLERFPAVRGTVFELPAVAARVRGNERLDAVAGDMLFEAPPQGDAYLLSHVLHDWDDRSCIRILENIRRAMPPHARVLVHEIVAAPPSNRWSQDRIQDLEMLAMLPGRERTIEEFTGLFEGAGLRLNRRIATGSAESILELLADPSKTNAFTPGK
jgi:hypothetical protein